MTKTFHFVTGQPYSAGVDEYNHQRGEEDSPQEYDPSGRVLHRAATSADDDPFHYTIPVHDSYAVWTERKHVMTYVGTEERLVQSEDRLSLVLLVWGGGQGVDFRLFVGPTRMGRIGREYTLVARVTLVLARLSLAE